MFRVDDLAEAGFGVNDLASTGYFNVGQMAENFTASELASSYSVDEIANGTEGKFSAAEIADAFSSQDLLASDTYGSDVNFLANVEKVSVNDLVEVKNADGTNKFDVGQLKEAGFGPDVLHHEGNVSLTELKEAGFGVDELTDARFTYEDIGAAGFEIGHLKELGFNIEQLGQAGFTQGEIASLGGEPTGFPLNLLKEAGFDVGTLANAKSIEGSLLFSPLDLAGHFLSLIHI